MSDLRMQLYFVSGGQVFDYTNNGDGTYSLDENYSSTSLSSGAVRIRYAKVSGSSNVTFSVTAVSVSYDYSTTINNYYDKSYVDALEARIAALENAN